MEIKVRDQFVFKRYELKYLITEEQKQQIKQAMAPYMRADEHGRSTITNLYYDTPDFLLARRSIEKPVFKEKLRMRSYGVSAPGKKVFVELKRKSNSVVYKRRVSMEEEAAKTWLMQGAHPLEVRGTGGQMERELEYFCSRYPGLAPMIYLSYEREAYYGIDDPGFRVTFDENILWRTNEMSLCCAPSGEQILPPGMSLMEIKTGVAIPLWMTRLLSDNRIYKTSFSKYGRAYQTLFRRKTETEKTNKMKMNGGAGNA